MINIVIIGGGAAGLMAAYELSKFRRSNVTIVDHHKAVGRKFLVAGHGGFNLTNSKGLDYFVKQYNCDLVRNAVRQFTNDDTITFLKEIGIPTYVGSSGKIFPEQGIKPVEVLNAWLRCLENNDVKILTNTSCIEYGEGVAHCMNDSGELNLQYDYLIFATGGASWSKTGSDGTWIKYFSNSGVKIVPFQASNAGAMIDNWSVAFEGAVLKNVLISCGEDSRFGEVELTSYGLEGAPVYALSHAIRSGGMEICINFKPTIDRTTLLERLKSFKGNKTQFLKELKIPKTGIDLIKHFSKKEDFVADERFVDLISKLSLPVCDLRPVEEVISTVGGIAVENLSNDFELIHYPKHYCIGEMVDWDAPTGGYLLQACFAMGHVAAKSIVNQCAVN